MPNLLFTIYLTDEEYVKYVPRKVEIKGHIKKGVRHLLAKDVNG